MHQIFRQDPDIIYAGEVRADAEYTDLVVHAAETGHLVLWTMHAHDAISPLYEMVGQGISRSLLTANLIGIACQRLLVKLCPQCRAPEDEEIDQFILIFSPEPGRALSF